MIKTILRASTALTLMASAIVIPESKAEGANGIEGPRPQFGPDCRISVTQLIIERKKFEGQPVIVEGYIVYGFERHAIYPTKEFADHQLDSSAISLAMPAYRFEKDPEILPQARYGIIRGTFRDTGNMNGPFIAAIERIDLTELKQIGRANKKKGSSTEGERNNMKPEPL